MPGSAQVRQTRTDPNHTEFYQEIMLPQLLPGGLHNMDH